MSIARTPVESSAIKSVGYDQADSSLHVEMKDGSIDRYLEVPSNHFDELLRAESVGRYFGANIKRAFERVPVSGKTVKTVYLDTETTGLDKLTSRIVEIAIIDEGGVALVSTRVNPGISIPAEATAIHGITDADVEGMPTLDELMAAILSAVAGCEVVIFNKDYDIAFLPRVEEAAAVVSCCMFAAKAAMGVRKWPRLSEAAAWSGYEWVGDAHSALADTLATRHVWAHVESLKLKAAA